jgi:hypothetical protein
VTTEHSQVARGSTDSHHHHIDRVIKEKLGGLGDGKLVGKKETEGQIGADCLSRLLEADIERKNGGDLNNVMAVVPAMDFETYWKKETGTLRASYQKVITHSEAKKL